MFVPLTPWLFRECCACVRLLPATPDFFAPRKDRPDGMDTRCRPCQRTQPQKAVNGRQRCTRCRRDHPATEEFFPPNPRMRGGLCSWCRGCVRRRARLKQQARRRDPNQRARLLNEKRRYARSAKGRAAKRRRTFIDNNLRRQRRLGAPWLWSDELWAACVAAWCGRCAYCGRDDGPLTQEHVVPLSDPECPGTVPWNIVPACDHCNRSKGPRSLREWCKSRRRVAAVLTYLRDQSALARPKPWIVHEVVLRGGADA